MIIMKQFQLSTRNTSTSPLSIVLHVVLLLAFGGWGHATAEEVSWKESPYSIVIDGGSTGSRLHIFEFVVVNELTGETDCRRLGSERSHEPLSSYYRSDAATDSTAVAGHMMPLFEYAATLVPVDYHSSTSVKFAATAGMRLLEPRQQAAVYDALYEGLLQHENFVFRGLKRGDIATLGGDLEGFYGAVAANFLKGMVDTKLKLGTVGTRTDTRTGTGADTGSVEQSADSSPSQHRVVGPLGALDMGGSSTQIVYVPRRNDKDCDKDDDCDDDQARGSAAPAAAHLMEEDFFSTSYLEYGVDTFRERLWDTWVQDRKKEDDDDESSRFSPKIIDNPCTFVGYEIEWKEYQLIGTGDAKACIQQVQRLIPHYEPDEKLGGRVGGVEHPPVRGKFFAMSLFYFSLDSLRALSSPSKEAHEALNLSWPTPSIQELHDALDGLCSRNWHDDLAEIQHDAHAYTRPEVLPHRCVESVYMVTLLRDGYGFDPSSRDITFTFLVDGDEVEWSLGLALSMHAEQHRSLQATTTAVIKQQAATEANLTREDCDDDAMDLRLSARS